MTRWMLLMLICLNLSALLAAPEVIRLWPDGAPGALGDRPEDVPTLTVSLAPAEKANGTAIVVCPGGGYGHLALDHEGKQIAAWLNENGVHAFILTYRIAPRYHHPAPLLDAQRAIRLVRSRAKEWRVQQDRIGSVPGRILWCWFILSSPCIRRLPIWGRGGISSARNPTLRWSL